MPGAGADDQMVDQTRVHPIGNVVRLIVGVILGEDKYIGAPHPL